MRTMFPRGANDTRDGLPPSPHTPTPGAAEESEEVVTDPAP